jgi:hypothetical protein
MSALEAIANPNLSNIEIESVLEKFHIPAKVIQYRELPHWTNHLDQLSLVIFFGFPGNIGHWCSLWKDDGWYHFFDPYGGSPDSQWKFVYNKYKEKPPPKYLSKFLSNKPVRYNPYNIQGYLVDHAIGPVSKYLAESECGELNILRLILKSWSDSLFFDLIKKMPAKDIYKIIKTWVLA